MESGLYLAFFFPCHGAHRDLHSFPTRRSSDLGMRLNRRRRTSVTAQTRTVGRSIRARRPRDRKSTRLNSSHTVISYAVFCLKKKKWYREQCTVRAKQSQRDQLLTP